MNNPQIDMDGDMKGMESLQLMVSLGLEPVVTEEMAAKHPFLVAADQFRAKMLKPENQALLSRRHSGEISTKEFFDALI